MKSVKPKKFLGQHFLKDLQVAQDIANTVDACPELPILEVGPGMGVLTQFLMTKERPLKVVELDFESVAYLRENFPALGNNIIEQDFLKMDLAQLFEGKPFVLTGNYPYNISSQIFFKMLDYKDLIPCCTGMIQKEVAERMAAGPGSKTYGILSVLIQAWYRVEYLFTVHEHVFNPPPKVKSAVIRMTRNETQELGCNEKLFKQIVKTTFNQRRKTLRNSISPILDKTNPLMADPIFNKRPERLSVQIWQEHIIPHIVIIEIGDVQHSLGAHLIAMYHHGSLFRSLRCIEIDGMGLVARWHRDKGILHTMVLIHGVHPANHPGALVLHSVLPMLSRHSLLLRIVERIIEHMVAGTIQAQHHKHHQAQSRSNAYLSHRFLFHLHSFCY